MGKPAMKRPAVRDDEDAVSMHTTPDDYAYDDVPELPSYSDSEATASASGDTAHLLPRDAPPAEEYAVINPGATGWRQFSKNNKPGSDTTIRMDERLTKPEDLHDYVVNYLALVPPTPKIRINGYHTETSYRNNKKETNRVADFDIGFNLSKYLPAPVVVDAHRTGGEGWSPRVAVNSDKVYRGSWRKTRAPGYKQDIEVGNESHPDLMRWCDEYCESKSALKVFRVSREVPGLDSTYLRENIEGLIRSTGYGGHINIAFPLEDKHVDIYNPHWVNEWRISWIRFISYFTFLWIFTWPILFFVTKYWNVYTINWCYSWQSPQGKRYAGGLSEEGWVERHGNMIRGLALEKYQGDATDLPLDAGPSEGRGRLPSTGNANVDAAVGLVHGGVGLWNSLSRGGGDSSAWGGDS
ncbi:hypothetical protein LTR78_001427 [Recurvomyces mirabilis]|uniref:Uncharacterized protein n=1 Tax=Recurvomyces mirabilis TaxID=574656 RepID=A0AAE1C5L4_9PEZI|nr:hypothetical protein LTR78_001427 [Recurvomyces mirabilis]KAK5161405.1 hypothetical protein LTS14_001201 [Recurvomyces mirabilis]